MTDGTAAGCVVCGRPSARALAGRSFCDEHYSRLGRENPGGAWPIAALAASVTLFAAIVYLFGGAAGRIEGTALVTVGLVLAVVPAAAWLVAFYLQDRAEPEPKHLVLATVFLGAVAAEALGRPVLRDVFRVQDWLYVNTATAVLGSVLVVGFVQEFLKYAVVRYTVFSSAEFDEQVDGIIYGAAAGLGFATVLNVRYVVGNDGVDLGVGAVAIAITALAHASYSGLTGYFLARAKFERMGPLWLPIGVTLAAALNGTTSYALRQLPLTGAAGYAAWLGLVAAALLAGGTFVLLFRLVRAIDRATLAAVGRATE